MTSPAHAPGPSDRPLPGLPELPGLLDAVAGWLPEQRWYAGKDHLPLLRRVGAFAFDAGDPAMRIVTLVVADTAVEPAVVYQVPLTVRSDPRDDLPGRVGELTDPTGARWWVYDGTQDLAYVECLLAVLLGRAHSPGVVGRLVDRHGVAGVTQVRVLTGEQSNTSIVCRTVDEAAAPALPVIVKVFRTLQPGDNPDVTVQCALSAAGSDQVPAAVGALTGQWPDPATGEPATGDLAFAQEFHDGARDAWQVALAAAEAGIPFEREARELGATTARLHTELAGALGTVPADPEHLHRIAGPLRRRAEAALAAVPGLADQRERIEAALARLTRPDGPPRPALQRIHGDYHLGQVLRVGSGEAARWLVVDFEGEPSRPLAERVAPDFAARDIAGMLRSFDYAAGAAGIRHPDLPTAAWAHQAQRAFLAGYANVAGTPDQGQAELIDVFVLDKALYEVVYEVNNRPSWLVIPMRAVRTILSTSPVPPTESDYEGEQ